MSKAVFNHPNYSLVADDRIVRNAGAPRPTAAEDAEVLAEVARFVEAKMVTEFGFSSIQIPEDEDPSTSILASPGWIHASKLLLVVQNAYGSQLGIFSRSICFDQGLSKGTWLPYIERAIAAGYAVLVLRPNTNSVIVQADGEAPVKVPIKGSESPEIHVLNVWDNVVSRAEKVNHIALLSYGNGASLCKDLFLREMVSQSPETMRIKAFITIEASHIIEKDDAGDIRDILGRLAVNMEGNSAPVAYRLGYRKEQLGCTCISLGLPPGVTEVKNVAASVYLGMDFVFKYLSIAESGGTVAKNFATSLARDNGLDYTTAVIMVNPNAAEEPTPPPPSPSTQKQAPPPAPEKPGFFSRLFGGGSKTATTQKKDKPEDTEEVPAENPEAPAEEAPASDGSASGELGKHIADAINAAAKAIESSGDTKYEKVLGKVIKNLTAAQASLEDVQAVEAKLNEEIIKNDQRNTEKFKNSLRKTFKKTFKNPEHIESILNTYDKVAKTASKENRPVEKIAEIIVKHALNEGLVKKGDIIS
jgi:hypothetical protein